MTRSSSAGFSIRRLRNYVVVAMCLGVVAYTAVTYVLIAHIFSSFGPAVRQDLEWKVQRGATELAHAADLGLAVFDADMVKEAFGVYAKAEDVLAIVGLDASGGVVTQHGQPPEDATQLFSGAPNTIRDNGDYVVTWAPSMIEGKEVGRIAVVVTTVRLRAAQRLGNIIATACIVSGVLGLFFGVLVIFFFTNAVDQRDKQLAEHAATLEHRVEDRTRELDERNRGMRLVLDNVAQGFITIDVHGVMAAEHSAIVDTWFGAPQAGVTFDDLVGPLAARFAVSFRMGLEAIRDGFLPLDLLIDQMPRQLVAAERSFEMAYTPLLGSAGEVARLLLVVTDVTASIESERVEREQRQAFALFQKIATDRHGFLGFVDESNHMVADLAVPGDAVIEKRILHTLKGNCGLYGLEAMVELTHGIESVMADRGEGGLLPDERVAIATAWASVEEKVRTLLGAARRDVVEVEAADLRRLLEALSGGSPAADVAATLRSWKNEPAARSMTRLGDHAKALARRLGKNEIDVTIDSSGVRLDAARWTAFWSNLVHAVRNAVDHGVEDPATRTASGKAERGEIRMSAVTAGGQLIITLADDGRGVDWERVRARARKLGLPHATQRDLVEALFADGLSTLEQSTVTSGRGVGLGALRQAVRELGGSVDVLSKPGTGSTFVFRFVATPSVAVPPVAVGRN